MVCPNILSVRQRTLVTIPRTPRSVLNVFRNKWTAPLPPPAVARTVRSTCRRTLVLRLRSRSIVLPSLTTDEWSRVNVPLCLVLVSRPVLISAPASLLIPPPMVPGKVPPTCLTLAPSRVPLPLIVVDPLILITSLISLSTSLTPVPCLLPSRSLPLVTLPLSERSHRPPVPPPFLTDRCLVLVPLPVVRVVLPLVPIPLVLRPRPVTTKLPCLKRLPFASPPETFSRTLRYLVKMARTLYTVPLLSP